MLLSLETEITGLHRYHTMIHYHCCALKCIQDQQREFSILGCYEYNTENKNNSLFSYQQQNRRQDNVFIQFQDLFIKVSEIRYWNFFHMPFDCSFPPSLIIVFHPKKKASILMLYIGDNFHLPDNKVNLGHP